MGIVEIISVFSGKDDAYALASILMKSDYTVRVEKRERIKGYDATTFNSKGTEFIPIPEEGRNKFTEEHYKVFYEEN